MPRAGLACHGRAKGLSKARGRSQDGRMTRPAPFRNLLARAVMAAAVLVALAPAARADSPKGHIFVSEKEFGSGNPSDAAMVAAIKKQSTSEIAANDEGGWTISVAIFLKEAAGANKINLVYYDDSAKHEQVNFSEVDVQPSQKVVLLNGIGLSSGVGFVKGHKYEVLATRLIGGKEKVYARGTITLK
jgi:hypothetical protein